MVVPAGPDRAACYATQTPSGGNHPPTAPGMATGTHGGPGPMTGGNHPQGDPCMEANAGPDRAACYAAQRP